MTEPIEFFVPGSAIGKGRPRVGRVGGNVRMFTPKKTAAYESTVALFASVQMHGRELFDGPVALTLVVYCTVPKSWSRAKKERAASGGIAPTTKPDLDNIVKAYGDAMNGIVYRDDVQIIDLSVKKMYSATPGVLVSVRPA